MPTLDTKSVHKAIFIVFFEMCNYIFCLIHVACKTGVPADLTVELL